MVTFVLRFDDNVKRDISLKQLTKSESLFKYSHPEEKKPLNEMDPLEWFFPQDDNPTSTHNKQGVCKYLYLTKRNLLLLNLNSFTNRQNIGMIVGWYTTSQAPVGWYTMCDKTKNRTCHEKLFENFSHLVDGTYSNNEIVIWTRTKQNDLYEM